MTGCWRISFLPLLCCLAFVSAAAGPAAGEPAARVVFASGKPVIVDTKGTQRPAERGSDLSGGETLESRDGLVQLRFRDGASMSLQPQTQFRVDDYRFRDEAGKASPEDRSFFTLIRGGLRTVTGLIGKENNEQYRMNTAVAVIGIRGTEYAGRLDDAGLFLSTFAGVVEVCNDAGCQLVRAGEEVSVPAPNVRPIWRPAGQGLGGGPPSQALPGLPSGSVADPKLPSQPVGEPAYPPQQGPNSPRPN